MADLNELMLVAALRNDGSIEVKLDNTKDLDALVAAIIRAACKHGCNMSKVMQLITKLRTEQRPTDEPMVLT